MSTRTNGRPDLDLKALRAATAFLRDERMSAPNAAVRGVANALGLDEHLGDLRLRLSARLRGTLAGDDVTCNVFDACTRPLPLKSVAAQLHLSLRQFYRVRDAMLERILAVLQNGARIRCGERADDATELLQTAIRMLSRGHPEEAGRLTEMLLSAGPRAALIARALSVRARALCDQGLESRAHEALAAAEAAGAGDPAAVMDATFARSFIEYRDGRFATSLPLAEGALHAAGGFVPTTPSDIRARISHLHFLAIQHQEGGSNARSVQLFLQARTLLNELSDPPKAEVAENLTFSAISRLAIKGQAHLAWTEASEALKLARWHGLDREQIWAQLALARAAVSAGDLDRAVAFAREALAQARCCLAGDELCRILTVNTRIEGAAGNGDIAVERIGEASGLLTKIGPYLRPIVFLCEADALLTAGRREAAFDSAQRAIDLLEGMNQSHYIGLAYLTRAEAKPHDARNRRDSIEAALDYLRKGGYTVDLARALEISAEATGNSAQAAEANDLRAAALL